MRESAAYALLQVACNHSLPADVRAELTELVAQEPDRYVLAMLAEAIAQESADAKLIRTLAARRWSAV